MIEQSIRIHDRHQVEIKLAYELDDFERAKSYDISLFFFLPASLGITPATYSKGDFYNDLIGRMRIKTPVVLLRDMASGPDNPLKKLETVFVSLSRHADKGTEIEYERQLKMFCCILKSALRDHIVVLARRPVATDQKDLVEQFLSYVEDTIKRFRVLRTIINVPTIGMESFSKYLFADEFVSMLVESYVYEMLEVLKRRASGAFQTYQARLLALVEDEIAHRRANGYPSIPNAAIDNEVLVFRKSVLKKYVESALFLTTRTRREGTFTEQTIFAVAAGLSMVFATAVAFFVQRRYGTMTFPLFVALINMISRCCSGKSLDERRFRIVLNKEGIKRIEMVNAQHMTFGHVAVGEGAQYPLIEEED